MCHTLCGVLNCRASCYTQTVVVIRLPDLELTTAIMPIELVRRLHAIQVYMGGPGWPTNMFFNMGATINL